MRGIAGRFLMAALANQAPPASPSPLFQVTRASARTTAGLQDITISGFGTPKAARIIANSTTAAGGQVAALSNSVGATDGTSQWVAALESRDGVSPATATRTWGRAATDAIAMLLSSGGDGSVTFEASFDSFIEDGIRINVTTNSSAATYELVCEFFGGSSLTASCGTKTLTTQNNSVTVTTGFQTQALFVETHQRAFNDTASNPLIFSSGVASYDGSTIRQCSTLIRDDQANPTSTQGETRTTGVATFASSRYAELATITSTQFNLTSRGADLSTATVGYLALNFGGAHAAWAGILDAPTATGNHDFTGPSFTPVFCTFRPTMLSANDTNATDGTGSATGICTVTATAQLSNHWRAKDGDAIATSNKTETDDIAVNVGTHDGTQAFDATFDSFLSNGVRLNFTAVNGTTRKWPFLFIG